MTRRIIVALLRFAMRIYFRRVEVAGLDTVPRTSPVIFVLNHPNALVDPAVLLCLAPRDVSFLAKAPLFRIPILGFFVRALDSLPVYRQQDQGEDVSKNREMFSAARKLLAGGGTIGICPEGVSHDEPRLKPIKTGAARIALAAVSTGEVVGLTIVPAGLYYTSKTKFRSAALLHFGKPIEVTPVELEANEPPRAAVRELSNRIEAALREVMLHAQHEEALPAITRAERIFSADGDDGTESLADELQLQQRFIKAYTILQERNPDRLHKLEVRMGRFEEELSQAGVDPDDLSPPTSKLEVFRHLLSRIIFFLLVIVPATVGMVVHYPAYRLGGLVARRYSKNDEDVVSTVKIISAMLLFPLSWLVSAAVAYTFVGWKIALVTLVLLPVAGYLAIIFFEGLDSFMGGLRALVFFVMRRRFFVRLLAERQAIRNEILALGEEATAASR